MLYTTEEPWPANLQVPGEVGQILPQYLSFVETGILPSGFPPNYNRRMLEIGVIKKKRHGVYLK